MTRSPRLGILLATLSSLFVASKGHATEAEKLAVLPLAPKRLPAATAEILDELLINELDRTKMYQVIGASDMNALLGLEKMKEVTGCDDVACAVSIGGALGVRYLIAGAVSNLGGEIIVTLKLLDTQTARVAQRAEVNKPDDERVYRQAIKEAVAQLLSLPAPTAVAQAPLPAPVAEKAPAPAPTVAEARATSADSSLLLSPRDLKRYAAYSAKERNPLMLTDWVLLQNQESQGLFVAELFTLGMVVAMPLLGVTSGEDTITPVLFGAAIITLPVLLIVDGLDIGSVQLARR